MSELMKTFNAKANLPGDPGVWVFITIDMFAFMLYFIVFTFGRLGEPVMFEQGRQQLNVVTGFINTLVLLTSSWLVVKAVEAAREQSAKHVKRYLFLAMFLGLVFVVLKITGYVHDIQAGHTIAANVFFGYYFMITGVHFIHVLLGIGFLGVCLFKARHASISDEYLVWIESVAVFWHMVDMLWVFLFPMFYLLRAA